MGKSKLTIRSIFTLILIMTVALLTACGGGAGASTGSENNGVITLKASSGQDIELTQYAGYHIFAKLIEERSEGRIKMDFVGGPESIPAFNQGDAVSSGVIDMSWVPSGYYSELVPESLTMGPSNLTYEEEIERGSIEYISTFHEEKMNAKLLGRAGAGQFAFFLKEPVTKLEDFKGMNIRGHAIYTPLMESVGASVIAMPGEEIYGSLEKGMIDGFGWGNYGVLELGVHESLIKAKINPPFNKMDIMVLMNLDTWNKIPSDLQEIIQQTIYDSYFEQRKLVEDKIKTEEAELTANGVQILELENSEEFLTKAQDLSWGWLSERIENIDAFKPYFIK